MIWAVLSNAINISQIVCVCVLVNEKKIKFLHCTCHIARVLPSFTYTQDMRTRTQSSLSSQMLVLCGAPVRVMICVLPTMQFSCLWKHSVYISRYKLVSQVW